MDEARAQLSGAQLEALYTELARRLESLAIGTQPEVAARLIAVVDDPAAGIADIADALKMDPALSMRLLRLSNAAFFAQAQPVTTIERACVILGLSRLRAVALGFSLARACADPAGRLSRRVWGESVFRACLANAIAEEVCPDYAPQAFLVGLLSDCGVAPAAELRAEDSADPLPVGMAPGRSFAHERENCAYTHVDVAVAQTRLWQIPALIAYPIAHHHDLPRTNPKAGGTNPQELLHRIAFVVGAIELDESDPTAPMRVEHEIVGVEAADMASLCDRAAHEYHGAFDLFSEFADGMDVDTLRARAHAGLVGAMDDAFMKDLGQGRLPVASFAFGSRRVDIQLVGDKHAVAYLCSAEGSRLASHEFAPSPGAERSLMRVFGIEPSEEHDLEPLREHLARLVG